MASRDRVAQGKSRAERSRPPTTLPAPPQVEIVAGRLPEGDWLSLLGAEEAEDAAADILAALLQRALHQCYLVYLQRQCIPYVISQAREAMLQILEWRFLVRDEGEAGVPTDPSWQEDEEPPPCATDAWAQGSVPVLTARPREEEEEEEEEEEAKVPFLGLREEAPASEEAPKDVDGAAPGPQGSFLGEEAPTEGWPAQLPWQEAKGGSSSHSSKGTLAPSARPLPRAAPPAPPPGPSEARLPYPQPRGQSLHATRFELAVQPLDSSEKELLLRELSQVPLEEEWGPLLPSSCSNLLRIQLGRPPNIKVVFYDESGNITLVPRLDPARLPKHWIKPSVEVVDPDVESRRQEALKTVSGRCRPRSHHRQLPRGRVDALNPSGGLQPPEGPQVLLWDGAAMVVPKRHSEQAPCPLQPPPGRVLEPTGLVFVKPTLLTERVEPAPGVTIRPGGSTARRPPQPVVTSPQEEEDTEAASVTRDLHPVHPQVSFPLADPMEQLVPEPRPLPRLRPGTVLGAGVAAPPGVSPTTKGAHATTTTTTNIKRL
ncbi:hypothetical protein JRQ81_017087 [Phrynocephalus forsythii]|uniref:Uncharacterized protein n=1 Tax=Phrynocephalus forsythii TaxID=171643 RepID=A0A9Q0XU39_9SAUR|nr:hypothetical protein JRQ81_017087 [Phrynocephalus forsythii]